MHILMLGGSGFIGRHLCHTLLKEGHEITILSRNSAQATNRLGQNISMVAWNPHQEGILEKTLENQDAVINLAGEPLADRRWSESRKELLRDSRIGLTRRVVSALFHLSHRPSVLINASGVGYYGPTTNTPVDETHQTGSDFLSHLCVEWEQEANQATELGVRVVLLRMGMVLGHDGGALPKMILPFRLFVGGPILPGTQPVAWIHYEDLVNLIVFLLQTPHIKGPVNAVAPDQVSMGEFCRALGKSLKRPSWIPVPAFVLKLGLGEMATMMTTGQAVNPTVAVNMGFRFSYPRISLALHNLVASHDS